MPWSAVPQTRIEKRDAVPRGQRTALFIPPPRRGRDWESWGEEQYAVMINGLSLLSGSKSYAMRTARDLRRALRGK